MTKPLKQDHRLQSWIKRHYLSLVLDKVIITQPQAEVFPLQLGSDEGKKLQRWPETCTFLTTELNLQVFQQQTMSSRR